MHANRRTLLSVLTLVVSGCEADKAFGPKDPLAQEATSAQRWSDPDTWGGRVPSEGEWVEIPHGKTVLLDTDPPALGRLNVHGTLRFDRRDISLTVGGIHVDGTLAIGSPDAPFNNRATITLTGNAGDDEIERGLVVMNGSLQLHGAPIGPTWTVVDDHATKNSTTITLASDVNWRSGDQVVIAPTDFHGVMPTERFTISEVRGRSVVLSSPLQYTHWGKLQYVTPQGMSLTPGAAVRVPAEGTPTVLDERAEVANLSRNIVIQGADDAPWREQGLGAHVMIMGAQSQAILDGVEVRRAGQSGMLRRYPIHFHQLSYDGGGNEVSSSAPRIVRNSAVWESRNRCITIHGTNDVKLDRNVCYDIEGHAVFLEDAVERRNEITNNLVLKVRFPSKRLLDSDQAGYNGTGSAGFWLTNPDNIVRGNHAADSAGNGFWMAFPSHTLGENKNVPIRPYRIALGQFSENTAHSNDRVNFQLDWAPVDDDGHISEITYEPTVDGSEPNGSNSVRFTLGRIASWKGEGIWNRPVGANLFEWTSADNVGTFFAGSGYKGRIRRVLAVGQSLNDATTWETRSPNKPPTAFASYHSEYNMQDNILVNFAVKPGPDFQANGGAQASHGGMLETRDYYVRPVELGLVHIKNNLLINSHPGFRVPKPDAPQAHWTIAGALWDAHGFWGPADHYWVYNTPFLTAGTQCQDVPLPVASPLGNGSSCAGPYYGMEAFAGNDKELKQWNGYQWLLYRTLDVRRLDENGQEIGSWVVRDGRTGGPEFRNMRHAALVKGGRFTLSLSDDQGWESPYIPRKDFGFSLSNLKRPDDVVVIGVPFTGAEQARAYVSAYHVMDLMPPGNPGTLVALESVGSLAEVEAGNGDKMWQDFGNNRVWIKVKSPVRNDAPFDPDSTDLAVLHLGTWVRVFSCPFAPDEARPENDAARVLCN